MANNKIQVKRTSTAGRTPNTTNSGNTQYIAAGELALNMTDKTFFTSDGTNLIYVGANTVDQNISNTLTVKAISANGSNGSAGQVLTTNATGVYWSAVSGGGGGGGANLTLSSNGSTVSVNSDSGTDVTILAANSTVAGVLTAEAQTIAGVKTFSSNVTISAAITANGSVGTAGQVLSSNATGVYWSTVSGGGGGGGANLTLSSNGSTVSVNSDSGTDVTILAANSTVAGVLTAEAQTIAGVKTFSNTIIGTANNALYLGDTIASGYQTTAGLSANVATLTSNNASYLGGTIASGYQTTAGLSANVATLAANSATYVLANTGIVSNATGVYVNSSYIATISANNASYLGGTIASGYQTTAGLSANVATLDANNASYLGGTIASGYQTTAGLSSNVATLTSNNASYLGGTAASGYQTTAGLSANVATLTSNNASYLGGTIASGYQTTAGLSANVATLTSNNASYFNGQAAAYYANASNIGSGTLSPSYGGTGVNNGAKTITLGDNISTANSFTTSGNFALTLTQTAATSVTLPITGTLATLGGSETLTSKTLSSATLSGTLTANGSVGTAGQVLTSNTTGVYWSTVSGGGGGGSAVSVSDTAPASPASGDLWFDSTDGTLNLYYNDGTSSQWVSAINNQAYSAYVTKTVNYTAINRDNILADTTAGSFTITLPASPAIGHSVVIYDNGSWGTNNLTIGRNLNTIEGIADDFTLDISSIKVEFIYNGSTWQIYSSIGQSAQAASGISAGTAAALAIALG